MCCGGSYTNFLSGFDEGINVLISPGLSTRYCLYYVSTEIGSYWHRKRENRSPNSYICFVWLLQRTHKGGDLEQGKFILLHFRSPHVQCQSHRAKVQVLERPCSLWRFQRTFCFLFFSSFYSYVPCILWLVVPSALFQSQQCSIFQFASDVLHSHCFSSVVKALIRTFVTAFRAQQGNPPISRSLIQSYLQCPFCHIWLIFTGSWD